MREESDHTHTHSSGGFENIPPVFHRIAFQPGDTFTSQTFWKGNPPFGPESRNPAPCRGALGERIRTSVSVRSDRNLTSNNRDGSWGQRGGGLVETKAWKGLCQPEKWDQMKKRKVCSKSWPAAKGGPGILEKHLGIFHCKVRIRVKLELPPHSCVPPPTSQAAVYLYVCPDLDVKHVAKPLKEFYKGY